MQADKSGRCFRCTHHDAFSYSGAAKTSVALLQLQANSRPRCRVDVGTYAAKNGADFILGFNVLEKCGSIRTVVTVTILRCSSSLGRIGDDHPFWTVDPGEATPNAGAAGCAR